MNETPPTSLVSEKQTEELNWVKKNKTNENDKKNTYDCRLTVLAAEPGFDIFFLLINFDQISFSYGLSTRKET